MIKTAIFVEGQTELVFVREYLPKWFTYEGVSLACYNLFKADADPMQPTKYAFPNSKATHHFQIANVGGDHSVLSRMLSRETRLRAQGFHRIIGLRDMYSEGYRKLSRQHQIDPKLNERFITGAEATFQAKAHKPDRMQLCWAIMETEAWLLGLYACFARKDPRLHPAKVQASLGLDLVRDDPETTYLHPAREVKRTLALADFRYDKPKGDINALMGYVLREDVATLLERDACQSFHTFHAAWQDDSAIE